MTDAERQFLSDATDLLDRLASCLLTWDRHNPLCPLCGFYASIRRRPEQDAPGEGGAIPHRHYIVRAEHATDCELLRLADAGRRLLEEPVAVYVPRRRRPCAELRDADTRGAVVGDYIWRGVTLQNPRDDSDPIGCVVLVGEAGKIVLFENTPIDEETP